MPKYEGVQVLYVKTQPIDLLERLLETGKDPGSKENYIPAWYKPIHERAAKEATVLLRWLETRRVFADLTTLAGVGHIRKSRVMPYRDPRGWINLRWNHAINRRKLDIWFDDNGRHLALRNDPNKHEIQWFGKDAPETVEDHLDWYVGEMTDELRRGAAATGASATA